MENGQGLFRFDRCDDLAPFRRALETAGFSESSVAEKVFMGGTGKPFGLAAVLRRTAAWSPLDTLVRLFSLGRAVPEQAARAALEGVDLDGLVALGLLQRSDEGIQAQVALAPHGDLFLARDFWLGRESGAAAGDYVPGLAPMSMVAAHLTVRRKVEVALDLGVGSGIQSLLASAHADQVIGTDTNPRALSFAELNARLAGVSHIELRRGSLYEPVAERRFDLLVCNPPLVVSPDSRFEYRDGHWPGDAMCEQVVRGAPDHLREGAYATVTCGWHHHSDEDWAERPRQWLTSSGCDAWIVAWETVEPIEYAVSWLAETEAEDPDRYARRLDEWLAYYERLGIGRISTGALIFRRRSADSNWTRAERLPGGPPNGPASEQIQRIFRAQDLLEELPDDSRLLDLPLVLTADHQLDQVLHARDENWNVEVARLRQTQGFPFAANVDRLVIILMGRLSGRRPLRELVGDLAAELDTEPDRLIPGCLGVVRKMLEAGFLSAASPGSPSD